MVYSSDNNQEMLHPNPATIFQLLIDLVDQLDAEIAQGKGDVNRIKL